MISFSIVLPAYNEAHRIIPTLTAVQRTLVAALSSVNLEVIVVCDGCTDDTEARVRRWGADSSWLRIISYHPNRGKGYALRTGIAASRGQSVAFVDADGAVPCCELLRLLPLVQNGQAEIVIGSRRLPESRLDPPQPLLRRVMGWLFVKYIRFNLPLPWRDPLCGCKLFAGDRGREIAEQTVMDGFSIDLEILLLARKMNVRVREEAITWRHVCGSSIHPVRDGLAMLRSVLRLRSRTS